MFIVYFTCVFLSISILDFKYRVPSPFQRSSHLLRTAIDQQPSHNANMLVSNDSNQMNTLRLAALLSAFGYVAGQGCVTNNVTTDTPAPGTGVALQSYSYCSM